MKLSTKGRYGTRAMLELALRHGQGPISVREIARSQEISERYLENLMSPLLSRGLVTSARGKGGGFSLARPPEEISLLEVIRATEGSPSPVACLDDSDTCARRGACVTAEIWEMIGQGITETLGAITLRDMVQRHLRKAEAHEGSMYYI
jgi:Rrf2 family cysteine metabolism transcriptional repressor